MWPHLESIHYKPDGLVPDSQTTCQIQLFQTPAVLGHLLHRLVWNVGIDRQRKRLQRRTFFGQVADGVVLQLATGGEIDGPKPPAVVSQAAQRQAVHPLAVSQTKMLEMRAAQGHSHQGVAGKGDTAAHVYPLQMLVLADNRKQLLVCDPVWTVLKEQVLENFIFLQHCTKCFLWDAWSNL